jgi:hypothetical protein
MSCIDQKWKGSEGFGGEEDGRERGMGNRIAGISNTQAIDHLLTHRGKSVAKFHF